MAITKQQLIDAAADAESLEQIVNGTSTVTTRLGLPVKSLFQMVTQLEAAAGPYIKHAYVCDNLTSLRALAVPTIPTLVHLLGKNDMMDGGETIFYFNPASKAFDDGINYIRPDDILNDLTPGRWHNLLQDGRFLRFLETEHIHLTGGNQQIVFNEAAGTEDARRTALYSTGNGVAFRSLRDNENDPTGYDVLRFARNGIDWIQVSFAIKGEDALNISETRIALGKQLFALYGLTFDNQNVLGHYKQGVFTPELEIGGVSSGITYTTQSGTYQAIGAEVKLGFRFDVSGWSGSGAVKIKGLPYLPLNTYGGGVITKASTLGAIN